MIYDIFLISRQELCVCVCSLSSRQEAVVDKVHEQRKRIGIPKQCRINLKLPSLDHEHEHNKYPMALAHHEHEHEHDMYMSTHAGTKRHMTPAMHSTTKSKGSKQGKQRRRKRNKPEKTKQNSTSVSKSAQVCPSEHKCVIMITSMLNGHIWVQNATNVCNCMQMRPHKQNYAQRGTIVPNW